MSEARVLICEDDPRYSRLLAKVLGAADGVEVVGQHPSGEAACRACVLLLGCAQQQWRFRDF